MRWLAGRRLRCGAWITARACAGGCGGLPRRRGVARGRGVHVGHGPTRRPRPQRHLQHHHPVARACTPGRVHRPRVPPASSSCLALTASRVECDGHVATGGLRPDGDSGGVYRGRSVCVGQQRLWHARGGASGRGGTDRARTDARGRSAACRFCGCGSDARRGFLCAVIVAPTSRLRISQHAACACEALLNTARRTSLPSLQCSPCPSARGC